MNNWISPNRQLGMAAIVMIGGASERSHKGARVHVAIAPKTVPNRNYRSVITVSRLIVDCIDSGRICLTVLGYEAIE